MLLEIDHISKIYGDLRAVDDLNLTVPEGEWLAIVGSSGSGKTTLMNMIGCMDTPSKGSVKLEGRKLNDGEFSFTVYRARTSSDWCSRSSIWFRT